MALRIPMPHPVSFSHACWSLFLNALALGYIPLVVLAQDLYRNAQGGGLGLLGWGWPLALYALVLFSALAGYKQTKRTPHSWVNTAYAYAYALFISSAMFVLGAFFALAFHQMDFGM